MSATKIMTFTETEMRKPPAPRSKLPPMFDEPVTKANWHKFVNWTHLILLTTTPIAAIYGMATTKLETPTLIFSIFYYFATGMGITAGYHRLWSHRSYNATPALKFLLTIFGAGAVQGSIRWWSRGHRAHHRYTDTDKDPYSANRGLFFSHIGWMLIIRPRSRIGYADVADLDADPFVRWQHKYYPFIALFMAFGFPTLVAGLGWGDWRGGYFYAGIARLVFVHHATFCVNSLAHYLGDTTFDDHHTPRDHFITAFVTLGEGYHNFHHEFPQDYRNAILFYQYDPTKWLINLCSYFGLAYNLKMFPRNEVVKGKVYMLEKNIKKIKDGLNWGVPINELPIYTWDEFQEQSRKGKEWLLIEGVIYDVSKFIDQHPGGPRYIKTAIGKDVTTSFNGAVYDHSNAARNLMSTLRAGVVRGGMEVESMKKSFVEEAIEHRNLKEVESMKKSFVEKAIEHRNLNFDEAFRRHVGE